MKYLAVPLMSTLLLAGCNSATESNTNIEMKASNDSTARSSRSVDSRSIIENIPVISQSGTSDGEIVLSQAWVNVIDIAIEHENGQEYTAVGPFAVDLITGESYPAIPSLAVPAGNVLAIEFELDLLEPELVESITGTPAGVTDWLQTSSMYISGDYVDTATNSTPITFENDMPESFRLVGDAGQTKLSINDDGSTDVVIAFRVDKWFDLSKDDGIGAADSLSVLISNGSILISNAGSNELNPTHDLIQSNIEDSTEYGEDIDGDGELSSSEDTSEEPSDS